MSCTGQRFFEGAIPRAFGRKDTRAAANSADHAASPLEDLQKSRGGRLLYKLIVKFAGAGKDRHTANMQRKVIAQMPVLGLTMGIRLSRKGAEGFVQIANGHRFKGIKAILRDLKKHRKKKK